MKDTLSTVFISYSHADKEWLDRLQVHLAPLERDHELKVFDDTRIARGSKWHSDIECAISQADAAVLIVSADFLASNFIRENELPPLLEAARDKGVLILCIIASPCLFERTPGLEQFQAVNMPSEPLTSMDRNGQEKVFLETAVEILNRAGRNTEREVVSKASGSRMEDFLDASTWTVLPKIGDWLYDMKQRRILGSGMHTYLLSRSEYGHGNTTIEATLEFSNFRHHLMHEINKMNAGIVFGWNSDTGSPKYYNLLLTGEEVLLERIGAQGGTAFSDWGHLTEPVPFPIEEGVPYDLTASIGEKEITFSCRGKVLVTIARPTGVLGRVGLRPWRSQVACTKFVVRSA